MAEDRNPMRCVHRVDDQRCRASGTVFAMGAWWCRSHEPVGAEHCSHSLAPSGRCAYCGAVTDG